MKIKNKIEKFYEKTRDSLRSLNRVL